MADSLNLSREVALLPEQSALLYIDVQNFSVRRDGGCERPTGGSGFAASAGGQGACKRPAGTR